MNSLTSASNSSESQEGLSSFCPYCGCGCRMIFKQDPDTALTCRVIQDDSDPISKGRSCVKGLTSHEMLNAGRILKPMIRRDKNSKLEECSWDEAYDFIKRKIGNYSTQKLRDKLYFVGSGEIVNEANYLLSKLCRSHFKSNNIDCCARLCHAATATAFKRMFGITGVPDYDMDDVSNADTFLFIGTDPAEDYPVLFNRILEAKNNGAKIITVDVASNSTTQQADLFLSLSPNGIIPLISELIVRLVKGRDVSRQAKRIEGYQGLIDSVSEISEKHPVSQHGITKDQMTELYNLINESKNLCIGFGMGLTQHLNGTDNVYAATALAILMDAILFPGRGKVNVQGAVDMGAEPSWRISENFSDSDVDIPNYNWQRFYEAHEGSEMTEALYDDEVDFVWIVGSNPSQSMPDLNALDSSFRNKFIILQHHHRCRTMEFADVVLPGAVLTEEFGSITNCERRVRGRYKDGRFVWESMLEDSIKSNSQIIIDIAHRIGAKGFDFDSPESIFKEMVNLVPGYENIDIDTVVTDQGEFANKTPKYKAFVKINYDAEHFGDVEEYAFVLTTARSKFQFCTGEGTSNTKALNGMTDPVAVTMNIKDAHNLNLDTGDSVKITSSVGELIVNIEVSASVGKRIIVAPYHFEKLLINRLTPRTLDSESKTPCYKYIRVNVEKV